ncbi:MAG TPA: hypothetical protein VN579_00050, partial [Bryobacteraceae bacterium]|nr:hypothetical protein [Bryobacteraceae bacterium]
KDEVRAIGRELGIPTEFLERHPFPGPGLGIRCLCSDREGPVRRLPEGWLAPIRSVGVQGDSRSYRDVLLLDELPSDDRATEMVNRIGDVNRVVARVASRIPLSDLRVAKAEITPERLARLRRADAIVRRISKETGFDRSVWQFPVVLIPLGSKAAPDSVVLRPIDSVDGMTAQVVLMPEELLRRLVNDLLAVEGIAAVFYDLTHKPPGTIEWE